MERISVLSFSHEKLDSAALGRLNLTSAEIPRFYSGVPYKGIVYLQTCNRREIYALDADLKGLLKLSARVFESAGESAADFFEYCEGREAVIHLAEVAAGIRSVVPGETEITGQVRSSFAASAEHGKLGPGLHRALSTALRAAKKARKYSGLSGDALSYAGIAAKIILDTCGLDKRNILIAGTGPMAGSVARLLVKKGARLTFTAGRNAVKSAELAAVYGAGLMELDSARAQAGSFDAVVSATSAPHYIFTSENCGESVARTGKKTLFIDLAIPGDVEPGLAAKGAILAGLDDIKKLTQEGLRSRRSRLEDARKIIKEVISNEDIQDRSQEKRAVNGAGFGSSETAFASGPAASF
jgi:glutamyl-tRNA reductase